MYDLQQMEWNRVDPVIREVFSESEWESMGPFQRHFCIQQMKVPPGPITLPTGLIMGAFYDINGEGAKENAAQVTTFEIELLCEHWAKEILEADRNWAVYRQTGSREMRVTPYANLRLHYFAEILGEEKVRGIADEVFEGFDPEAEREAYEQWLEQQGKEAQEADLRGETCIVVVSPDGSQDNEDSASD
jgi:hypothetical protein